MWDLGKENRVARLCLMKLWGFVLFLMFCLLWTFHPCKDFPLNHYYPLSYSSGFLPDQDIPHWNWTGGVEEDLMLMAKDIMGRGMLHNIDLHVCCVSLWCRLLGLRLNPVAMGSKSTHHTCSQVYIPDRGCTTSHTYLSRSTNRKIRMRWERHNGFGQLKDHIAGLGSKN